ncbi:MAG TPA: hypothetical protein VMG12_40615 [Polyangiaceae bacterium]|nr:hypothetical protein [Polyangiaceae bacterium]
MSRVDVAPGPEQAPDGGGSPDGASGAGSTGGTGVVSPGQDPPLFDDVPPPAATEPRRCAKVDFLYVIDNSPTMVDKQENLARSFIGFSRIVSQTLGTNDHHIMVIDTDANNAGDVLYGVDSAQCASKLGAGRRVGSEGEDCSIEGNQRFVLDQQENLESTFSCLAKVGIYGNAEELPIQAMLNATGGMDNETDECNAGFLRDDAVLVVTIITDEDDEDSSGQPSTWKVNLLRAKGGNEESVVVLGLIADNHIPGGLLGGPCDEFSGSPSPRLEQFVRSFDLNAIGSVCAPDYSGFFAAAVSNIDTACDDFVPVVR